MTKCFADDGTICTALKVKECRGCAFFKTTGQKRKDDERTKKRLDSLKDKIVNIYF